MVVNVYAGEALAAYGFGNGHPFSRERFGAFWCEFQKRGLDKNNQVQICEPVKAEVELIKLFHTAEYIDIVQQKSQTGDGYLDYGDTPAFAGVYDATAYVVGSSVAAAKNIISGKCQRAFVPIAGLHHARREIAAGFCVFNDCGIVVEYLLQKCGLQRVAYVDIDAHHGDGVYYGFESDPRVIFADIHEDGRYLYPGTGREDETGSGEAQGKKLNIPVPMYADDQLFTDKFSQIQAFLNQHNPEFIILQCGADSVAGDPLTHMEYSWQSHYFATQQLRQLADDICEGKLLCLGGGGYNLRNIANTWCGIVEALL